MAEFVGCGDVGRWVDQDRQAFSVVAADFSGGGVGNYRLITFLGYGDRIGRQRGVDFEKIGIG